MNPLLGRSGISAALLATALFSICATTNAQTSRQSVNQGSQGNRQFNGQNVNNQFLRSGAIARSSELAPLLVTATRSPQAASNLISDIDVVSTQSLRAQGALSLLDGLGTLSGVGISANGGPGATGSMFLRGASAGQTLVLIDGFRISSVSLGQPTYEALPLNLVERVEVLRGPGSGLYGADALGGVVQMFTPRSKSGRHIDGELALGTQSTLRLVTGIAGGSDALSGSLRVSREKSDGYNATRRSYFGYNADDDGYKREGIIGSLQARLSANSGLRLIFLRNNLDTDFDDGAFVGARTISRTDLTGLSYEQVLSDQTLLELKLGRSKDRSESIAGFPGLFETTQDQIGISARRNLSKVLEIIFSYERLTQSVDTSAYAPNSAQERKTDSYGVSLSGREGPHIVQLGVRRDKSNQYEEQTNTNFAYGYVLNSGLRLGGSYASGFRAPGFNDLYFPGYGRAEIKPESSRNYELGAYLGSPAGSRGAANKSAWRGKFVYFNNSVRDLIVYAPVCPDPDPQFALGCADNVNRATLKGFNLSLAKQVGAFAWHMNADFLTPKDKTLDKVLARRARRKLSIGLEYELGKYRFGSQVISQSSSFDDAGNTIRLGGFTTMNLSASMVLAPNWDAFLTVTNATDKDYETASGFVPQGRLMMLGVRYQPGL